MVHTTAAAEGSAFLAAKMARRVENHGRSRYATPWEEVTTIAQWRQRLEESRQSRIKTGFWIAHAESITRRFMAPPCAGKCWVFILNSV